MFVIASVILFVGWAAFFFTPKAVVQTVEDEAPSIGFVDTRARALFISAYHPNFPTVPKQIRGLKSICDREGISLDEEFMDSKRFPEETMQNEFRELLKAKLAKVPPYDVVIVSEDNGLAFALREKDTLFKGLPIVFFGVNNIQSAQQMNQESQITGVVEATSVDACFEHAVTLLPDLKALHCVTDNSRTGRVEAGKLEKIFAEMGTDRFRRLSIVDYSHEEFAQKVATFPEDEAILLFIAYRDKNGDFSNAEQMLERFRRNNVRSPIFVTQEHYVRMGALGGKVVSHYHQGKSAAEMAVNIINGTAPQDIPVQMTSPNVNIFHYDSVVEAGISIDQLPADSVILNLPVSFYLQYRQWIHAFMVVLVLCVLMMFFQAYANRALWSEIVENKRLTSVLELSERQLKTTLNAISDAVLVVTIEGKVENANPAAFELCAVKEQDLVGHHLFDILDFVSTENQPSLRHVLPEVYQKGKAVGPNFRTQINQGPHRVHLSCAATAIRDAESNVVGAVVSLRNVTEQIEMESQLRQNVKMDSIGQLAGGVAHDFNNMLGGILGAAEILKEQPSHDETSSKFTNIIIRTCKRASDLTRKLLSFSRKGTLVNTTVDIHSLIEDVVTIVRSGIDRRIEINNRCQAQEFMVIGDPSELQSALLNLAVNARDAMSSGGKLSITTMNVELDKDEAHNIATDLKAGRYIRVVVSDTGGGIPSEVLPRIFEPFYTTKELGEGTGLGLAAVYGTVHNHMGAIQVESVLGRGATFTLHLPLAEGVITYDIPKETKVKGQGQSVLVVEDEPIVQETVCEMLSLLNFTIYKASDGEEALSIFEQNKDDIDIVLLDVVLPKLRGDEVFDKLRAINPNIPIVLASGFTQDAAISKLLLTGNAAFVQKPFSINGLFSTLATLLGLNKND